MSVRRASSSSSLSGSSRVCSARLFVLSKSGPFRCPVAAENHNFPDEIRELFYGNAGKRKHKHRISFTIRDDTVHVLLPIPQTTCPCQRRLERHQPLSPPQNIRMCLPSSASSHCARPARRSIGRPIFRVDDYLKGSVLRFRDDGAARSH
jgi:hypothetical protein